MKLFTDLLNEVADANRVALSDCLFKAKLLAAKLKGRKFRQWVEKELTGYPSNEKQLPPYRRVPVAVLAQLIGPTMKYENVQLDTRQCPDYVRKAVETVPLIHSVGELEARERGKPKVYHVQIPPQIAAFLERLGVIPYPNVRLISAEHQLTNADHRAVLHAIRNRLLDFLLELGKEYPELEKDAESSAEVPPESSDRLIERIFYQINISGNTNMSKQEVTFSGPVTAETIVIADRIKDSFNRATESAAPAPLKDLLGQLAQAVETVAKSLEPAQQTQAADDFDTFSKAATRSEPRKSLLKEAGKALLETVAVAGKLAEPVTNIVGSILKHFAA